MKTNVTAIGHRHPDGNLHARLADGSERIVPPEKAIAYSYINGTRLVPTYGADSTVACDCPHCRWSRRQPEPTGH